ncbi:hypothetical protein GCM10007860_10050 [Chitiniphilus shinanonensis]|uniref:Uncharacterized protein n=1 Tax=Chitiniphilus shinanonensis TaxID=553088 RepID=A0ABQ6BRL4_9NEIS|nr:hypothetical protein GCM10007860_10050 [Chitiniphilus shinanonensis]
MRGRWAKKTPPRTEGDKDLDLPGQPSPTVPVVLESRKQSAVCPCRRGTTLTNVDPRRQARIETRWERADHDCRRAQRTAWGGHGARPYRIECPHSPTSRRRLDGGALRGSSAARFVFFDGAFIKSPLKAADVAFRPSGQRIEEQPVSTALQERSIPWDKVPKITD